MDAFKGVIGQKRALNTLNALLFKKELPHALLFEGPPGVGKSLIAFKFAAQIASNADIHRFAPEGKTSQYSIEAIRQLTRQVHLSGFGKGRRLFVLDDAHKMPPPAANALLKTLEEPAENAHLILLSGSISELLPTLSSRCVRVSFKRLSPQEIKDLCVQVGVTLPIGELGHRILAFGRADFALRSSEKKMAERLKLFENLLFLPIDYSTLHLALRRLEKAMQSHLEEGPKSVSNQKQWSDAPVAAKEQWLKNLQAQAQHQLFEELEFFVQSLIDRVNRESVAGKSPWVQLPTWQLADDLNQQLILWQRGARISQILEALYLKWSFLKNPS